MAKKKIGDLIIEMMNEFKPETYEVHRTEFVKEAPYIPLKIAWKAKI